MILFAQITFMSLLLIVILIWGAIAVLVLALCGAAARAPGMFRTGGSEPEADTEDADSASEIDLQLDPPLSLRK